MTKLNTHLLFFVACLLSLTALSCKKDKITSQLPEIPDLQGPNSISELLTEEQQGHLTTEQLDLYDNLWDSNLEQNKYDTDCGNLFIISENADTEFRTALADADNCIILFKAGVHQINGTILIEKPVQIVGEEGAIIKSDTEAGGNIHPLFHIKGARNVSIRGLRLEASRTVAGTAVYIENSPDVRIDHNTITDFQFGVIIDGGDRAKINGNVMDLSLAWQSDENYYPVWGIAVVNGQNALLFGNEIDNAEIGIWVSDTEGLSLRNGTNGGLSGSLLCRIIEGFAPSPTGDWLVANQTATNWIFIENTAYDNNASPFGVGWGFLLMDGPNHNCLVNNEGSNNTTYDIEIAGETERFSFPAASSDNNVIYALDGMIVKDCGQDNTVVGGDVDIVNDCF